MKNSVAILLLFISLFISGLVRAENHTGITLDNLLIRAVHGGMAVTAGFVTITNTGSDDDRLISVSTGFAGKSGFHTMAVENGIMKMRPLARRHHHPRRGERHAQTRGAALDVHETHRDPADRRDPGCDFRL